jgi:uncharacterized protein (TIGR00251 family)
METGTDFSDAIRPKGETTLIDIIVTPNSKSTGIKGFDTWRKRVMVEVKEPPIQNRANREITSFFSKLLSADVEIVSGATSTKKTLEANITEEVVRRALYEGK